jgi:AcrR family transcriptional regulator
VSTKDKILTAAVDLFNEHGTAHISANHIAEQAGISPGNLYYHYENKEHIIRSIYEKMIADWDSIYEQAEEQTASIQVVQSFVIDNFRLLWDYRFFYRETVALLHSDEALRERHVTVSQQRLARQRDLLQHAGVLKIPTDVSLDDLLTIAWIVANQYLNHLESMGQRVQNEDFATGADLVMLIFQPYIG